MTTTDRAGIIGGSRTDHGYWRLTAGPGEEHLVRSELVSGAGVGAPGEPLLTVGHLSDLHVCDTQSPVRAEFLDRWSDDDAPTKPELNYIGTYRAQELLTTQVADAMVTALNAVRTGPIGGAEVDWAIATGDVTDNAQSNELSWYINLLEGGSVTPDSGSADRYEGVADSLHWDEAFWHPEPDSRSDRPRRLHGFPTVPGLLDAARATFAATGLTMPWLAVHGNHDQMIQGTHPAIGPLASADSDVLKVIGLPPEWSTDAVLAFCHSFDNAQLDALSHWRSLVTRPITADPARRAITRGEFVAAHFNAHAKPVGHGFTHDGITTVGGRVDDAAYYRYDHGRVTVLTLDTVNQHGGWQGSLDARQLHWLQSELAAADAERRYVVIASHHPLGTLVNAGLPLDLATEPLHRRIEQQELAELLSNHRSLVLWLNGHTHKTEVRAHGTWWEVTAPSLIDFPQQGRVVELLRSADGTLTIATTMLDHAGELPWSGRIDTTAQLAGLARELAVNDWQRRTYDLAIQPWAGRRADRNALLRLPDPYAD